MKRIIILAVALTAGLSSCDFLDTEPLSQITQTDYFKTETDLQLFSNPFYNNLLDKNPYDDQSDLVVCQTLSDEILGGNKRTVPNSGGGWTWTDLRRINYVTYVIDPTNYALEAARNFKWEVRADLTLAGNRLSVTYFEEDMKSGFRTTSAYDSYDYKAYDELKKRYDHMMHEWEKASYELDIVENN